MTDGSFAKRVFADDSLSGSHDSVVREIPAVTLRQRLVDIPYWVGFRPAAGSDRALFASVEQRIMEVEARRRVAAYVHPSDLCYAVYIELLSAVGELSMQLSRAIWAEAAVTIKLLWADPFSNPVVRTFIRDQDSRLRSAILQPPDNYSYRSNTAFETIVKSHGEGYFVSDDLMALKRAGRYENVHGNWQQLYNSTAVSAIRSPREPHSLIGFVCADSKFGRLSGGRVRALLEEMARHIYTGFGVALSGLYAVSDSLGEKHHVGWDVRSDEPQLIDSVGQQQFQNMVELMEGAYSQRSVISAREWEAPSRLGEKGIRVHNPKDVLMDTNDLPPDVDENDLDPKVRELLKKPITDEKFVEILEKIASNNPYACGLLEAARRKGVGRKR